MKRTNTATAMATSMGRRWVRGRSGWAGGTSHYKPQINSIGRESTRRKAMQRTLDQRGEATILADFCPSQSETCIRASRIKNTSSSQDVPGVCSPATDFYGRGGITPTVPPIFGLISLLAPGYVK